MYASLPEELECIAKAVGVEAEYIQVKPQATCLRAVNLK
jgi:hypothetical protein